MYCTNCGNKLNDGANYCTRCGTKQIVATIQIQGGTRDYEHNADEEEIANLIVDDLGLDKALFKYTKPCQDYSTMTYKNVDLFRLKYTDKARWIKCFISKETRAKYSDDKLFESQKNKGQVYWKSTINSIFDYKDILLSATKQIDTF